MSHNFFIYPKRAVLSVSLNDKLLTARRIDEEAVLEALGYTKEQLTEILAPEDIKYQQIYFLKGRSSDLVIFNRYIFLGQIRAATIIRIWKGDNYWEFVENSPETLCGIKNAINKALYWQQKVKRLNSTKRNFAEREEAYLSLPGTTLKDLAEETISPKRELTGSLCYCGKE